MNILTLMNFMVVCSVKMHAGSMATTYYDLAQLD